MDSLCLGQLVNLNYRYWIRYTINVPTNLVSVLDVQIFLCSMLPKYCTHDAVFDNKYMKLFDARPNASNIGFADILETPLYFV